MLSRPIVVEPIAEHAATLIFLYELGNSGSDWCTELTALRPDYMKIVCLRAPVNPAAYQNNATTPAWLDSANLYPSRLEDRDAIKSMAFEIHKSIIKEATNFSTNRIVLGGFAEGGAIALYAALTYPLPLAGVLGLSCWLPLRSEFPRCLENVHNLPIFLAHGDADSFVSYQLAEDSAHLLNTFMADVQFVRYENMKHTMCSQELVDVNNVLHMWTSRFGAKTR